MVVALVLGIGLAFAGFLAACGHEDADRRRVVRETTFLDVIRRCVRSTNRWLEEMQRMTAAGSTAADRMASALGKFLERR